MNEIKPWQDRVKPGAFTGVKMEAMLAEIAELRAALAKSQPVDQGEAVAWMHPSGGVLQRLTTGLERDTYTIPLFTHPVRPMSETTAWLIELNIANAPCWLTGTGAYTNDANEALQFVREIDAKAMLDVYMGAKFGKEIIGIYKRHFAPENYRVTEHIFHGIKVATE